MSDQLSERPGHRSDRMSPSYGRIPHPIRLTVPLTSFVGREREVLLLADLLRRPDILLVTLTGPPGVGKTRLALRMAALVRTDFADGIASVDLASVERPGQVFPAIARAFRLRAGRRRSVEDWVADYLRRRQLLLILDNFEHLVGAAKDVVGLLQACPSLTALVTSRTALRVQGEHEFAVSPFPVPDPGHLPPFAELAENEAIALFVERAQASRPDFALTAEGAGAVARICYRLDGPPLAIELAAARIKHMSVEALLTGLTSRLAVLTQGAIDLPDRQRTLRGAIRWSFELLEDAHQIVFRQLAVFEGGFTLEAATAVAEPNQDRNRALEGISALVDHSLAFPREQPDAEPGFRMLQTIREFGLEELSAAAEEDAIRRRHATYFQTLAERARAQMDGPDAGRWLDRLELDLDNLRTALEWLLARSEAEMALALASALWRFWDLRGYLADGRRYLERALAIDASVQPATRARALRVAGALAHNQGDHGPARNYYEQARGLYRGSNDAQGEAAVIGDLALLARHQSRFADAKASYDESLQLLRAAGDRQGQAKVLDSLGVLAYYDGDYQKARDYYQQSLALDTGADSTAKSLINIAILDEQQGRAEDAIALYRESLGLLNIVGDKRGLAEAEHNLAVLLHHQGNDDDTLAIFGRCVDRFRELGDRQNTAWALINLAGTANDLRALHLSPMELLADAREIFEQLGDRRGEGHALRIAGEVAHEHGRNVEAARLYGVAVQRLHEVSDQWGIAECFRGSAGVAADCRQWLRAARLFGKAESLREPLGVVIPAAFRAIYDERMRQVRIHLHKTKFQDAWTEGRDMPLERAISETLAVTSDAYDGPRQAAQVPPGNHVALSKRELAVLRELAAGHHNREIAEILRITERTVSTHLTNIYNKLGVDSARQAIAFARENHLLEL